MNDTDVILLALQKERDDLHNRILQVDRIINRVKSIDYRDDIAVAGDKLQERIEDSQQEDCTKTVSFPKSADIKIQVLRVFDIVAKASSLSELQQEYTTITGSPFKIRETVRSLQCAGIVKVMKYKNASRGFLWVKTDWINDGVLLDKYKPLGFDLLHKTDNLLFL